MEGCYGGTEGGRIKEYMTALSGGGLPKLWGTSSTRELRHRNQNASTNLPKSSSDAQIDLQHRVNMHKNFNNYFKAQTTSQQSVQKLKIETKNKILNAHKNSRSGNNGVVH